MHQSEPAPTIESLFESKYAENPALVRKLLKDNPFTKETQKARQKRKRRAKMQKASKQRNR